MCANVHTQREIPALKHKSIIQNLFLNQMHANNSAKIFQSFEVLTSIDCCSCSFSHLGVHIFKLLWGTFFSIFSECFVMLGELAQAEELLEGPGCILERKARKILCLCLGVASRRTNCRSQS